MNSKSFDAEIAVLRRAWEYSGRLSMADGCGSFVKLRNFYFEPYEFDYVLQALRALPSIDSGLLPLCAVKYLWRMNEFLLVYRENYSSKTAAVFRWGQDIDIHVYDKIQAEILDELNRILGSPVESMSHSAS